jgi:hypothetical protein
MALSILAPKHTARSEARLQQVADVEGSCGSPELLGELRRPKDTMFLRSDRNHDCLGARTRDLPTPTALRRSAPLVVLVLESRRWHSKYWR